MKFEQLTITAVTPLANGFHEIKLHAPVHAKLAQPGHYVSLEGAHCYYLHGCQDETIWLIVDQDTPFPLKKNHSLVVSSLQGAALAAPVAKDFQLIQADEKGLNAAIFYLKQYKSHFQGLVLLGAKQFPFYPCPSRLLISGMPPEVIAALPLFEDWHIPHRLASTRPQPGCFHGTVQQLTDIWEQHNRIAQPMKKLYIACL